MNVLSKIISIAYIRMPFQIDFKSMAIFDGNVIWKRIHATINNQRSTMTIRSPQTDMHFNVTLMLNAHCPIFSLRSIIGTCVPQETHLPKPLTYMSRKATTMTPWISKQSLSRSPHYYMIFFSVLESSISIH